MARRALELHVFEQVRHAVFAVALVARAHQVGDVDGNRVLRGIREQQLDKPMPKVPEQVEPYLTSFRRFVEDFSPKYEAAEASVFNRKERYAGTLDAIVGLRLPQGEPGRYVLDAKSGKGVYPEVGLQLAAYRYAEFIGAPDGSEQPMPETDGGLALHLTPDGYKLIEVDTSEQVYASFLYAREVYRFQLEISKTVLGAEYTFGELAVHPAQQTLEEVA